MKSQKLGFTLIELLIVISLLGVLAVGLLATIDPFEQLKKGRDTSTRNMVEEFYNGTLRYYAVNNNFPWATGVINGLALNRTLLNQALSSTIAAGELKQAFADATGRERIYVTSTAGEDLTVCFQPQSRSFRIDNNNKYNASGVTLGTAVCPNATSTGCYWCIR